MKTNKKPKIRAAKSSAAPTKSTKELFKSRESQELILGFSGAVGCGIGQVTQATKRYLEEIGYKVEIVKLSDIIIDINHKQKKPIDVMRPVDRYINLQTAGNQLRDKHDNDILAELATSEIASKRASTIPAEEDIDAYVPLKTAYLIDQLKHPAEVEFMWSVYGHLFTMIGVFASYNLRKKHLIKNKISKTDAEIIMDRDRKEAEDHGQQLDKTLLMADFFVRNNSNINHIEKQLKRLINLTHGENGTTPTQHEYAMYVAHSAGLKSACLSKQVGASITDKKGNIISTGFNDVPRAGGGLYNESDGANDHRCVHINNRQCSNDLYKTDLRNKIKDVLISKGGVDENLALELVELIRKDSRLKGLIEFSRSVHAEMDALTAVARTGGSAVKGGYLYTTTFPCHNCARHIIASGIKKVFYIEPYEKSLAVDLHSDSIDTDSEGEKKSTQVQIIHFEGVAPRRYLHYFTPQGERKDKTGTALVIPIRESPKKVFEYIDSYRDLEKKVVTQLIDAGLLEKPK